MKNKFSCGPDNIPTSFYKNLALVLAHPLSLIFECSLRTGTLPNLWKQSNVVPIFKKGHPNEAKNYRPISLTCVSCRIFESLLVKKLRNHLWSTSLISHNQHGFLNNRSTTTNLLEYQKYLHESHCKDLNVDAVYLDVSKAFDSVTHRRLISILEAYGITGDMIRWIKNYLTNRTQRVKINQSYSSSGIVTSGVPQGSCLGPLLFLIYINDIETSIKSSKLLVYADDCKIFLNSSIPNYQSLLEDDLNFAHDWLVERQLQLSIEKCAIMYMGKSNSKHEYKLGGSILASVDVIRDLGVNLSNTLKMSTHIFSVKRRASAIVNSLFRCFSFSKERFMLCYKTKVLPILEYGSEVFAPLNKGDIMSLEVVQRRFTKRLLPGFPYKNRLEKLKLSTLWKRRLFKDLCTAHKYIYGHFWTSNIVTLAPPTSVRHMLRGNGLKLSDCPPALVNLKFISSRIAPVWNRLPAEIALLHCPSEFKCRLEKWFLSENVFLGSLDPTNIS